MLKRSLIQVAMEQIEIDINNNKIRQQNKNERIKLLKERCISKEGFFDIFKKKQKEVEEKIKTHLDLILELIKEVENITDKTIKISFIKPSNNFNIHQLLKDIELLEKAKEFNLNLIKQAVVWHTKMYDELKKSEIDEKSVLKLYNDINNNSVDFLNKEYKKLGNFNYSEKLKKAHQIVNYKGIKNDIFILLIPEVNFNLKKITVDSIPKYESLISIPFFYFKLVNTDIDNSKIEDLEIDKSYLLKILYKFTELIRAYEDTAAASTGDYSDFYDISGELQMLDENNKIDDNFYSSFAYSIGEDAFQFTYIDILMNISIVVEKLYKNLKVKIK